MTMRSVYEETPTVYEDLDKPYPLDDYPSDRELLESDDADLRVQAALALGHRRDARATAALLRALTDADDNVRFQAIESLGRLRAPEAAERLTAIAETREFFLAFPALDALARIGDGSVVGRLLALLDDEVLQVAVIDTVGRLGDESVVSALAALLDRPEAPTAAVAQALAAVHDRAPAAARVRDRIRAAMRPVRTQQVLDAVHRPAAGPRALAFLVGCLEGPAAHRALTRLLGRAEAREEAVRALVADGAHVVDILLEQLSAADLEVREPELGGDAALLLDRQAIGVDPGQRPDQRGLAVIDVARGTDDEVGHGAPGA